jgi:hypothetical protein
MRSLSMLQLVGGVVAAGAVAAGATAFTATTGVKWGVGAGAGASQYVGGTLTQTVSGGASIDSVVYTGINSSANNVVNDRITGIAITVTGANGAYLTVTPANSSVGFAGGTADEWYCSGSNVTAAGDATAPKVQINSASATTVNCQPALASDGTHALNGYYSNLTGVSLAVTNS